MKYVAFNYLIERLVIILKYFKKCRININI